jgi:hypothetical protein
VRGDLHAHTANSDGKGTPAQGFAYAKKTSGLDFLILTDHTAKVSATEWTGCHKAADAANDPGTFIADCGFETLAGGIGHSNVVFNGNARFQPTTPAAYYTDIAGCTACVAQINHPESPKFLWTDFTYVSKAKSNLALYEFNGGGSLTEKLTTYVGALGKGWHLAPTHNGDNHAGTPGAGGDRSGFWVTDITRKSLQTAMRERRSFGTADANSQLRMMVGSCWMGSVLKGVKHATIDVSVDDTNDGFDRIVLLGKGNKVLSTIQCGEKKTCSGSVELDLTPPTWVFAYAIQHDGDAMVGAPIWFE